MKPPIIHVKVSRGVPGAIERKVDVFSVPRSPCMTVQTLLRYIHENLDPTLSFRDYRCGSGLCNTCLVRMNGKIARSCLTLVPHGDVVEIEPASGRVIRDLVTEFE